ncbi:MAG: hypothetical protein OH318_02675 [Candidatus Parvarchaeota archaeon]|nr:hypothetical protein [Candidatus Rehaiarchaeum fermentans]
MDFIDTEPQEVIIREGTNSFLKINLTKGKEGEKEIEFISIKRGYYLDKEKKEERIKNSISINFDELPLLIDALTRFKQKLEEKTF